MNNVHGWSNRFHSNMTPLLCVRFHPNTSTQSIQTLYSRTPSSVSDFLYVNRPSWNLWSYLTQNTILAKFSISVLVSLLYLYVLQEPIPWLPVSKINECNEFCFAGENSAASTAYELNKCLYKADPGVSGNKARIYRIPFAIFTVALSVGVYQPVPIYLAYVNGRNTYF